MCLRQKYKNDLSLQRVNRGIQLSRGALLSHNFFWGGAGLLFLITHPICDTAWLTLYEREVLAPGAGHRGASSLISSQVMRQSGRAEAGTRWDRRRGEGGTGNRGTAPIPTGVGFVLPEDPCCAAQACRGQITEPEDEWMWEQTEKRTTTRSSNIYPTWWKKKCGSSLFLVVTPCSKHVRHDLGVWKPTAHSFPNKNETCNKKK